MKLLDDLPARNELDNSFESILEVINYLFNSSIGMNACITKKSCIFQFLPNTRIDAVINDEVLYYDEYGRNLVPERHEIPEIVKIILKTLPKHWPMHRLSIPSTIGELPISKLLTKLYSNFGKEEIRKNFLTYFALVQGRAQVEYGEEKKEQEDNSDFVSLPVDVREFEEVKEELINIKEKLRLRRLSSALMSWLTDIPLILDLDVAKTQRQTLYEKIFISMMYIKEERLSEATRLVLPKNIKNKWEIRSEINLLKIVMRQVLIKKGMEAIRQEQQLIADLLKKNSGLLELPKKGLEGISSIIYANLDVSQKGDVSTIVYYVKTFAGQIKNRATHIKSDAHGISLLITLHDFNNIVYNLCKNIWRFQINQKQTQDWNKQKIEQEYQEKYYNVETKTLSTLNIKERMKKSYMCSALAEVGQRCYNQIYVTEKGVKQRMYFDQVIQAIEKKLRKIIVRNINEEIKVKDKKLKELYEKFTEYKESLMKHLKDELMDDDFSMRIRKFIPKQNVKKTEETEEDNYSRLEEAYNQLQNIQLMIHKFKVFHNLRLLLKKEKYEKEVYSLRDSILTNIKYHSQLSLSERREFILKQELVRTQENMVGLEKTLKNLQANLKVKNETLIHFNQERNARIRREIKLEARLKEYKDKGNALTILEELKDKDKELEELKNLSKCNSLFEYNKQQAELMKRKFQEQFKSLKQKLENEKTEKEEAFNKIKSIQQALNKTVEDAKHSNDENLWKEKCKDLLNLCKALKSENQSLRQVVESSTRASVKKNETTKRVNFARKKPPRKFFSVNNSIHIIGSSSRMSPTGMVEGKPRSQVLTPSIGNIAKKTADAVTTTQSLIPTRRPKTQTNLISKINGRYYRAVSRVNK